jgi:hypothetical protein
MYVVLLAIHLSMIALIYLKTGILSFEGSDAAKN